MTKDFIQKAELIVGFKYKPKSPKTGKELGYTMQILDVYKTTNIKNELVKTEYKVQSINSSIPVSGLLVAPTIQRYSERAES